MSAASEQPSGLAQESSSSSDALVTPAASSSAFSFSPQLTVEQIRQLHRSFSVERDWEKFHTPRNLLLALVGEVGELSEVVQWKGELQDGAPELSAEERQNLSEEISDCLLYLVALADHTHVDLSAAVQAKMAANAAKYPADRVRGSSKKYNEYARGNKKTTQTTSEKESDEEEPENGGAAVLSEADEKKAAKAAKKAAKAAKKAAKGEAAEAEDEPSPTTQANEAARQWPPPPPPREAISVAAVPVEQSAASIVHLTSPHSSDRQPDSATAAAAASVGIVRKSPSSASSPSKRVSFASDTSTSGKGKKSSSGKYVGGRNDAGQPHGQGTLYRADGSIERAGIWKDGQQCGRGRHVRSDGGFFEGELRDNKKDGVGRFVYPDGAVYEGQWVRNAAEGYGCKWDRDGVLVTCGRAANNSLAETCPVPRQFLPFGSFLSEAAKQQRGDAVLVMPDGGFYVGATNASFLPHGRGVHYAASGEEVSAGTWVAGVLHGDARTKMPGNLLYEGEVERGQRHGYGRCTWLDDGSVYEGEWVAGAQCGLGRQVLPSGHSYEGEFEADQPEGQGAMWDPEGHLLVCGRWVEATLVEAGPIQRSVMPLGVYLSEEQKEAEWVYPDGGFYTAPAPGSDDALRMEAEVEAETQAAARALGDGVPLTPSKKKKGFFAAMKRKIKYAMSPSKKKADKSGKKAAAKEEQQQQQQEEKKGQASASDIAVPTAEFIKEATAADAAADAAAAQEAKDNEAMHLVVSPVSTASVEAAAEVASPEPVIAAAAPAESVPAAAAPDAAAAAAAADSAASAAVDVAASSSSPLPAPSRSKSSKAKPTKSGSAKLRYLGQKDGEGKPHGYGTQYRADGTVERAGQWKDGMQHGRGRNVRTDGGHYDGAFAQHKKHGLGRFVYADGSVYEGQWDANNAHGFGVKWNADGSLASCGKAVQNALAETCPVPLSMLPFAEALSDQARQADLLMPDGGFYVGEVHPELMLPHGHGTQYNGAGQEVASGQWAEGTLQRAQSPDSQDGAVLQPRSILLDIAALAGTPKSKRSQSKSLEWTE